MRVIVEQLVEWRLAGETEVLGENLPQRHFLHHKSHMSTRARTRGRRGGKPATNRLSYGATVPKFVHNFQWHSVYSAVARNQVENEDYASSNSRQENS
jgi:hypothetical protein